MTYIPSKEFQAICKEQSVVELLIKLAAAEAIMTRGAGDKESTVLGIIEYLTALIKEKQGS